MDGAENRYITINSPPASQFLPPHKKQSMPQDYSCKHDTSAALTVFFHCDSSNVCVTCYTLSGFLSSFCLSLFEILLSGIHFQA